MSRINDALDGFADRAGAALSSRWAIAAFALVSLTALPQAIVGLIARGDLAGLVGWFSQNFVQLVALAVLAFLADRQERAAATRNADMYDWLSEWHIEHAAQLQALHDKVDDVAEGVTS